MHGERLNELDRGRRFREDQEPFPFQHEAQQSLPRSVPFADDDTDARNARGSCLAPHPEPTPSGLVAVHADAAVVTVTPADG